MTRPMTLIDADPQEGDVIRVETLPDHDSHYQRVDCVRPDYIVAADTRPRSYGSYQIVMPDEFENWVYVSRASGKPVTSEDDEDENPLPAAGSPEHLRRMVDAGMTSGKANDPYTDAEMGI